MSSVNLADLPPELLSHITTYLPTAQSLNNLNRTNKSLQTFAEENGWQTFSRTRFPSLYPSNASSIIPHKDTARALTTLSKAWDRRAFVSRYIEPHGNIRAFPGDKRVDRWKRPRGQTIGFTPQLDCYESTGADGRREETLAFTAGAEICLRERRVRGGDGDDVRWVTYRPLSSVEGRDDVTCMHLLKPQEDGQQYPQSKSLIAGTANGDLQLIGLPPENGSEIVSTHFGTNGQSVRSSSLWQEPFKPTLLAANLGDSHVALYTLDSNAGTIDPTTEIDIRPQMINGRRDQRVWSTNFLSASNLAIGLGPSEEPLHIYTITPSGLEKEATRRFARQNVIEHLQGQVSLPGGSKRSAFSIYPVVPLSPAHTSAAGSEEGQVFLSGAYDGFVRLHDLRSHRDVEGEYGDPTDDSPIYSLLARGRETLVAGTGRHSLLQVFDLRLGSKAYSYLDATNPVSDDEPWKQRRCRASQPRDWSLFLKPPSAPTRPGRVGGNNWARRSAASSIYSLASSSATSPYIYAGVENAVVEMAFTSILDPHPDPAYFRPAHPQPSQDKQPPTAPRSMRNTAHGSNHTHQNSHSQLADNAVIAGMRQKEILDLAMYDQATALKLCTQRSVGETLLLRSRGSLLRGEGVIEGRDERWKVGS